MLTTQNEKYVCGMIPHHDDVDLAILAKDVDRLKKCSPVFAALGYKVVEGKKISRIIIEARGFLEIPRIKGERVTYPPFIDLFVFKPVEYGYDLCEEGARLHPSLIRGWFTKEEFENYKVHTFGGIKLATSQKITNYLQRKCETKCLTQAFLGIITLIKHFHSRDSFAFAKWGMQVVGMGISETVVRHNQKLPQNIEKKSTTL